VILRTGTWQRGGGWFWLLLINCVRHLSLLSSRQAMVAADQLCKALSVLSSRQAMVSVDAIVLSKQSACPERRLQWAVCQKSRLLSQ
jgi:hypothetical protein